MNITAICSCIIIVISIGLFLWDKKNREYQDAERIIFLCFYWSSVSVMLLFVFTIIQSINQKMSIAAIIMYILYALMSIFVYIKVKRRKKLK